MLALAIAGNLPLLWHADILKATTLSGTMVLGLAPPFLFWRWHRPAPLAFHFSLLTGLVVGITSIVARWPAALSVGTGRYAALLGQNAWGLVGCAAAYGLGVAIDSARARSVRRTAEFFVQEAA